MNQLSYQDLTVIKKCVDKTLSFFVNSFQPYNANFPLISNTYGLWRLFAFRQLQQLICYKSHQIAANYQFYLLSERLYLQKWLQILKDSKINFQIAPFSQSEGVLPQLQYQYNSILWKFTLYCELFLDLVNCPYLHFIFPPQKKYRINQRLNFMLNHSDNKNEGVVQNAFGNILKKAFGTITNRIFTQKILLQASTLAISFNPFTLAASYAFSELIDYYKKQKREQDTVGQMQQIIQTFWIKVNELQEGYEESLELLGQLMKGNEIAKKQFEKKVMEVVEVDWLQVDTGRDEQGWPVVILSGKKSRRQQQQPQLQKTKEDKIS